MSQPAPLLPTPGDRRRAPAVVAHPDDLEHGAAGAVARWTSGGREVEYLLVTRGEAGPGGHRDTADHVAVGTALLAAAFEVIQP